MAFNPPDIRPLRVALKAGVLFVIIDLLFAAWNPSFVRLSIYNLANEPIQINQKDPIHYNSFFAWPMAGSTLTYGICCPPANSPIVRCIPRVQVRLFWQRLLGRRFCRGSARSFAAQSV